MKASTLPLAILSAMLAATCFASGCHTAYQCPILQPMALGTIPAPLPPAPNDASDSGQTDPQRYYIGAVPTRPWSPEGDSYKVVGYRPGLRFYVVRYNDQLYRGGDIVSREGAQSLKDLGIKTIISLTPSDQERALAKEFGMVLVEMPPGFGGLTRADMDRFVAAVGANAKPIYVHDFYGGLVHSGALLAYYRVHKEGWSADRALNEYWRLDANSWDAAGLANIVRASAAK